jgi:hypothetical protein
MFNDARDAITDLVMMTAQAEGKSLPAFVDTLHPDDMPEADRKSWNRVLLSMVGESCLMRAPDPTTPAN